MPIAIKFAKHVDAISNDYNKAKIVKCKSGIDATLEVGDQAIQETTLEFTDNAARLREVKFHIVAVPTPIKQNKTPNLDPIIGATRTLGQNLVKGSMVVYESTVYPGATEDVCIPILEEESGLTHGGGFHGRLLAGAD